MFSFLPQIIILLALVGIITVVLRKTPEVTDIFRRGGFKRLPAQILEFFRTRARPMAKNVLQKLWRLVLDVKAVSKTSNITRNQIIQRFKQAGSRLPKANLGFFKSPKSSGVDLSRTEQSFASEDFEVAEQKFITVIKKDPKNEAAFEGLGRLYMAKRNFGEAVETYKFLIRLNPANPDYYSELGQAYYHQRSYDKAFAAYEQAIELAPDSPASYINLGLVLEGKSNLKEAILNYRRAVDLENNNSQFLILLAEALIRKGDKDEAENILEQVLQLEPTNNHAREKLMQLKF